MFLKGLVLVVLMRRVDAFLPTVPFQNHFHHTRKPPIPSRGTVGRNEIIGGSMPGKAKRRFRRRSFYDWRDFKPKGRGLLRNIRWIVTGASNIKQSDEDLREDLASVARLILLLRQYEELYPTKMNPRMRRDVICKLGTELYESGAPMWALEPVMQRVAEGLTGESGIQFCLLPRRVFIFYPGSSDESSTVEYSGTEMMKTQPGFHMSRLGTVEQIAVRLASFASNTNSVERLGSEAFRMPTKTDLSEAREQEEWNLGKRSLPTSASELAKEILDLASETYGLFFFLNTMKFQQASRFIVDEDDAKFWKVDISTRELFSHLAAQEASEGLAAVDKVGESELYNRPGLQLLFQFVSSAGASAYWFGGSIYDMIVGAILSITVGYIGRSKALAFEERLLSEVVASFVVGLIAGLLSIKFPGKFCFGACAVSGVLPLMQGFKLSYSVIEVMSRHLVAGSSRMLEALLFTGLVAYNLKSGLVTAYRLVNGMGATLPNDISLYLTSFHPISKLWWTLLLPLASFSWSGLFRPSQHDMPLMMFHGMLAFILNFLGVPSFAAAMTVTFSAGLISRFTGREAIGNTLAGLYALVPGAYAVKGMMTASTGGLMQAILTEAAALGLGAWTGTIICSPLILGKSSGLHGRTNKKKPKALLYF